MNFNDCKHAEKLKEFIQIELKSQSLPVELTDDTVIFKTLTIKQVNNKMWQIQTPNAISAGEFRLRACAVLAANCYLAHNFTRLRQVKDLDSSYWWNEMDRVAFKQQLSKTTDPVKRDVLLARYSVASSRSIRFQQQITQMFGRLFDK